MRFFTFIYLLLLSYVIAALIFWEVSLQRQSGQIYRQQMMILQNQVDSTRYPDVYQENLINLRNKLASRTTQYISEGGTFLVVIFIGAMVVFTAINRRIMLSRQQNNFMLSVTHELKSPIAAMKLNLQTLEKYQLDEEKKKQLLDRCIKETNRLNDLCNNMLFASQLEGRQYKPAIETFDLSGMVEDTVEDYAERYPRSFNEDIDAGCKITGDKVMLQIALNNLLENAIKYTPEDKPITISLSVDSQNARVQVADQGPGIPDNEKKNIFNKFYRVGNEESRKTKGTGIGLYLTHKIVLQHKGRITIKDNHPTGSVFEICIPV
jgi:signal transduction histidine kinase